MNPTSRRPPRAHSIPAETNAGKTEEKYKVLIVICTKTLTDSFANIFKLAIHKLPWQKAWKEK